MRNQDQKSSSSRQPRDPYCSRDAPGHSSRYIREFAAEEQQQQQQQQQEEEAVESHRCSRPFPPPNGISLCTVTPVSCHHHPLLAITTTAIHRSSPIALLSTDRHPARCHWWFEEAQDDCTARSAGISLTTASSLVPVVACWPPLCQPIANSSRGGRGPLFISPARHPPVSPGLGRA